MISKKRLLRLVKKALETEEQIIPIYTNHCRLFSDCLELDESTRQRFIEVFAQLRDDSRGHRETLDRLFQTIEEEL